MTETAAPRDQAQDTIAIGASTMGHDLLAALLAELRTMPDHWSRISADLQQKIIERLSTKTRDAVDKCVTLLMRSEFQAVPAKLEFVNRKGGIRAGITVNGDALCRHALFDAAGGNVLVVIADPKRWTERMDEIKAKDNQQDLFDPSANYDPAIDQPGYRRDQDRLAPAGKTWAELKASLGAAPAEPEPKPEVDEAAERQKLYDFAFAKVYGKSPLELTEEERTSDAVLRAHNEAVALIGAEADELVGERILQERLAEHGFPISLGTIQSLTHDEYEEGRRWVEAYSNNPEACTLDRPLWIQPEGPGP